MKAKNNLTAALLGNSGAAKIYVVKIQTRNNCWVEMRFNNKDMAQQEYDRHRSQGVYGGYWIEEITIADKNEIVD